MHNGKQGCHGSRDADQHVQLALMRMDMDDDDDDIRSASSALRESTTNLHR